MRGFERSPRWLLDPSEVLRLPGRRSLVLFRSDVLRYPVLASKVNYRSWRHWQWWRKYDRWPAFTSAWDGQRRDEYGGDTASG
jgi:type IV secretion system protein VirD4